MKLELRYFIVLIVLVMGHQLLLQGQQLVQSLVNHLQTTCLPIVLQLLQHLLQQQLLLLLLQLLLLLLLQSIPKSVRLIQIFHGISWSY